MDTKLVKESSKKADAEMAQERSSKRAGDELEQESTKKQKVDEDKETTELQSLMKIVLDEEEIMPPRMRTRSAGRPAIESLGGGTGEQVGRGGRGRRPREGNDELVNELNGQGNHHKSIKEKKVKLMGCRGSMGM
ncbi:hypothetical protein Tco_0600002 [Tanacetum coccineum]|uniref:Uncharacterized protein n=1 Tax=Tanacetum coccineum TaxID=301880 RepID=A0ABQ4WAI8_9ASTR